MYKRLFLAISSAIFVSACGSNNQSANIDNSIKMITKPSSTVETPSTKNARIAYINPITGELTPPSSSQKQFEQQAAKQSTTQYKLKPDLVQQRLPDGSFKIDIPEGYYSNLTATIDGDKNLKVQHEAAIDLSKENIKTARE